MIIVKKIDWYQYKKTVIFKMNPHGLWVRDLENPLYLRCVKHIVNVMTHIVSCPDVWSGCCGSCNKGHASLKATGSSRYMIFLTSRPPTDWWFFVSWNQKGMKWKNRIYYFYRLHRCLFVQMDWLCRCVKIVPPQTARVRASVPLVVRHVPAVV